MPSIDLPSSVRSDICNTPAPLAWTSPSALSSATVGNWQAAVGRWCGAVKTRQLRLMLMGQTTSPGWRVNAPQTRHSASCAAVIAPAAAPAFDPLDGGAARAGGALSGGAQATY